MSVCFACLASQNLKYETGMWTETVTELAQYLIPEIYDTVHQLMFDNFFNFSLQWSGPPATLRSPTVTHPIFCFLDHIQHQKYWLIPATLSIPHLKGFERTRSPDF
jgi:hypothetical protein